MKSLEKKNWLRVLGLETMIFDISDGATMYKECYDLFVRENKVVLKQ